MNPSRVLFVLLALGWSGIVLADDTGETMLEVTELREEVSEDTGTSEDSGVSDEVATEGTRAENGRSVVRRVRRARKRQRNERLQREEAEEAEQGFLVGYRDEGPEDNLEAHQKKMKGSTGYGGFECGEDDRFILKINLTDERTRRIPIASVVTVGVVLRLAVPACLWDENG